MPANTSKGYPYPLPTEPVAEGAQAIRNLAESVEATNVMAIADKAVSSPTFIDFPSIPQTYKHLLIVAALRGNGAGVTTNTYIRCNGNATVGAYSWARMGVNDATQQNDTLASSSWVFGPVIPAAGAAAGNFGAVFVLIPNYTATSYHAIICGGFSGAGSQYVRFGGGLFISAAAITRVALGAETGDSLAAGSKATLYGLG